MLFGGTAWAIALVLLASRPALGSPSPKRKEKTASRKDMADMLLHIVKIKIGASAR